MRGYPRPSPDKRACRSSVGVIEPILASLCSQEWVRETLSTPKERNRPPASTTVDERCLPKTNKAYTQREWANITSLRTPWATSLCAKRITSCLHMQTHHFYLGYSLMRGYQRPSPDKRACRSSVGVIELILASLCSQEWVRETLSTPKERNRPPERATCSFGGENGIRTHETG